MKGTVVMNPKEQRIYRLALEVMYNRLSIVEFSTLIEKSYRQSQRILKKIEAKQMLGVKHGNLGRRPVNKIADDIKLPIVALFKKKYYDFNLCHFQEKLRDVEGIEVGRETIRKWAHEADLVKKVRRRRGASRLHKPRPRMPKRGMLIQFDGSEHDWFSNGTHCTLIGGIDDATSEVVGLGFFSVENLPNCLQVLWQIVREHGVPEAIYLDQAGYFGKTHKDQEHTQIGRALDELGCKVILARSPQAKGKVERLWGTLQDRLIAELRLNNIKNISEANCYLKEKYIAEHNKKFSVLPRENSSSFARYQGEKPLKEIFCIKHQRKISPGNMFSYDLCNYVVNGPINYRYRSVTIKHCADGSTQYEIYGKLVQVTNLGLSKVKPKSIAA